MKTKKAFLDGIDSVLALAASFAQSPAGKIAAAKPFIKKRYAKRHKK